MKRIIQIFLLLTCHLLFELPAARAEIIVEDSSLIGQPLARIEILGNQVTHREIILREMETQIGSRVALKRLLSDFYNVEDLNLFNRVEFKLTTLNHQVTLLITVTEKWYIFPEPYWYVKNENPNDLIYGFRYRHKNFRGENETLLLNLWSGADRGFTLFHSTPWMRGTPELGRTLEFYQLTQISQKQELRDQELEERQARGTLWLGKRWNLKFKTDLGLRFRTVMGLHPAQTAAGGKVDRLIDLMLFSAWDTRDLRIFPRRGALLQGTYINTQLLDDYSHYQRWLLEARGYASYTPWSFAGRAAWSIGTGTIPQYDWYYARETNFVRSSKIEDEGPFSYVFSGEVRLDLLKVRHFTWRQAPFLRQYFKDLPYGVAVNLFVDAGDLYEQIEETSLTSLLVGYGFGILPILPYVDVVRMEVSYNPSYSWNAARISLKTGISF